MSHLCRHLCVVMGLAILTGSLCAAEPAAPTPLTLVVMDPLSAPLACDCVQGYAQRKYEALGNFLSQQLQRPVRVYWSESLAQALEEKTSGAADLVIGKHSVVLHDAAKSHRNLRPVAALTGQDGATTQTGLIVVRSTDPATKVEDLAGYRIFFGPEDCDEKSLAPKSLLQSHGVTLPSPHEICPTCSIAATKLVELDPTVKAAAVVSSYAEPLLQGCGAVKKGELRVVGTSDPVAFITAFVEATLSETEQQRITQALLNVSTDADLMIALETGAGFVEYTPTPTPDGPRDETASVSKASVPAKKKN
ncbi:MAG: PhnD/SsuA/transferrin family substrate-binding protein [Planctomycetaceae bacterium]